MWVMACPFQDEWFLEREGHRQMMPKDASSGAIIGMTSERCFFDPQTTPKWCHRERKADDAYNGAIAMPKRRQNDPQMMLGRRCRLEETTPATTPTLKQRRQWRNNDAKKSRGAKRRLSNCLKRCQNDASPGGISGNACSAFSDHQIGATPSASHRNGASPTSPSQRRLGLESFSPIGKPTPKTASPPAESNRRKRSPFSH